jgi:hypothetical protein
LISGSSARIEVEAGLGQSADNDHGVGSIIVLPSRDDIPALTISGTTSADLDRGQVRTEVARQFVNEETSAIGCLA